jgi:hypothetical protein
MSPRDLQGVHLSRLFLRFMVFLNVLAGLGLVAMAIASFLFSDQVAAYWNKAGTTMEGSRMLFWMRIWLLVGWPVIPMIHALLVRLIAIVDSVEAGDPFVPANALLVKQIAWLQVGIQCMHLLFGVFANVLSSKAAPIAWKFSWAGWIAVAVLFVLAHVFEAGTRMRADLEGTV